MSVEKRMANDLLQTVDFWNNRAELVKRLGHSVRRAEATPVRVRQRNCDIHSVRLVLDNDSEQYIVTKDIQLRRDRFKDDVHYERTKRAYEVEIEFYKNLSTNLSQSNARVPNFYDAISQGGADLLLILEDLSKNCDLTDISCERECQRDVLNETEAKSALKWLATFHSRFLGDAWEADRVWSRGSYWSLDKRQKEREIMLQEWKKTCANFSIYCPELFTTEAVQTLASDLAQIALELHNELEPSAELRTLLHGDFKTANLFFLNDGVAACDFQWIGPGLGVVDAIYLLYSSVDKNVVLNKEQDLLYDYYQTLLQRASERGVPLRRHYPWAVLMRHAEIAYLDYVRFLIGSLWGSVTPLAQTHSQSSINQGIHRRDPDYMIMMVRKAKDLIAAYRYRPAIP